MTTILKAKTQIKPMPHLALTIGDPTGIGPEITVKALQRLSECEDVSLTVIGSMTALQASAHLLGLSLPQKNVSYHAIEHDQPGAVAYHSITHAVQLIKEGKASALVTGPISKRNLASAGYAWPGHTEILEHLAQGWKGTTSPRAEMLFVYQKMRMMLLTRHAPLSGVPQLIAQRDKVGESFNTLIHFLRNRLNIKQPRLAVLAVNPHAGETGGTEESATLKPLMQRLEAQNLAVCGEPLAADAFFRGYDPAHNAYDAIIAMYHDQGLIPFKMMAGYEAVNVTIGLPFLRTSVSHGTAEDIVGQSIADERSLLAALRAAIEFSVRS